jgi:hypothetical protein
MSSELIHAEADWLTEEEASNRRAVTYQLRDPLLLQKEREGRR